MTQISLIIDGVDVSVEAGSTILDACRAMDNDQPTLCYLDNLTPVNVCRVCVVEVENNRLLVPSCSRPVEEGMVVNTKSERVDHSRKMVYEFLASSVNMELVDDETKGWMDHYGADPSRYGPSAAPTTDRDDRHTGHHHIEDGTTAATVAQDVKIDNDLYIRDYSRCILCYKCVEACGEDAQNTFAIAVAGRGFDARISTEFNTMLTDSACVYCGNCIGVCPTGALMFRSEHQLREADMWKEEEQTVTTTVCSYCGVGCNLELHVQDNRVVKVTSPLDHSVTSGHLCIKGRFGYEYIQQFDDMTATPIDEVLSAVRQS